MKNFIIGTITTLACLSCFGQGTVDFANIAAGLNAPVFFGTSVTKVSGPYYEAGLLAGSTPANLSLLATTPFLDGAHAGYFTAGQVAVSGVQGGGTAGVQVVAWDSTFGSFAEAQASGRPVWGQSSVFSVVTGDPGASPPGLPAALVGLTSFSISWLSPQFWDFAVQPTNQTVVAGATATFYVRASAFPPPSYQWSFNGTAIPGATDSTYQISDVQMTNAGNYRAVLSDPGWGSYTSASAILTVQGRPVITSQPQSQSILAGGSADLQIGVIGAPPFAYQWLFNGSPVPGATNSALHLGNVQLTQSGTYVVVVTNDFGAVTSDTAMLTVNPLLITSQPESRAVFESASMTLQVTVSSTAPITYQWLFGGGIIPGAVDSTLLLTNVQFSQAGIYSVVVTNVFGAVTSAPAMLTVLPLPPSPPSGTLVSWGRYVLPSVATGTRFTALTAGWVQSLALTSDGTIVAWGMNAFGEATVPPGLSNTVAIASGAHHNLALKPDRTVVAWGDNQCGPNCIGQTNVPPGLTNVVAIAAGQYHSLALKSDGTVVTWGGNSYGKSTVPTGLSGVTAVAAGADHSLALKSDGTVVSWGYYDQSSVPAGLSGATAIAAGYGHSLALKSDGTVVAWGDNTYGQSTVPLGLKQVIAIAAGGYHSLALESDGTVVAWGVNWSGQAEVPAGLSGVVAIAAGVEHSLALKSDGSIVPWGDNSYGQSVVPGSLRSITAVAAGEFHNLALLSNRTVLAWGANYNGQTSVPLGLTGVIAVAAGDSYSLALKTDCTVVSWGTNALGEAVAPPAVRDVTAIAARSYHNLALRSDGTVVDNGITVPPETTNVIAIAAGEAHSMALKSDHTILAWGSNASGQTDVPEGLADVIAIAAGGSHSLALRSNGIVVAWGDNTYGQSTVPAGLSGVVGIAAGFANSLALKSDGTIVAWGSNQEGQSSVPSGLSSAIAIAAGWGHSLGLVASAPLVQSPPLSQTVETGSSFGFEVRALGDPPLTYSWFFNGATELTSGRTDSNLLLSNVQLAQAGTYTVVVTNASGAVTSAPAALNVVPPVERRWVPGLTLTGQSGMPLNLDFSDSLVPISNWTALDSLVPTNGPQWYFDLCSPLPAQRFYRAWQTGEPNALPALDIRMIPALTLTGAIGGTVRVDAINQFGPTDAWFPLATVTLTNTSQLYFDTSAIGQPPRLWRIVPVP